ncbi:sodium channel protein Nach-like [Nymphalis io]|uniref:sodium channel protein Nach-like n=1 Tax=Inachis io TaxID=171585 RepID=UPI002169A7D3|nr:sodium channel protein Nach-like [Nymphalis io]
MIQNYKTVCDSIFTIIKRKIEYFGDMSNLHGINNLFSTSHIPYFKRLFWFVVLTSSCFGASIILQSALKLFSTGVASYSLETNYLDWNTPFPAVTVCEQSDNGRVKAYLTQHRLSSNLASFFKDVAFWNVKYCRTCNVCKINETCVENFENAIEKIRHRCSELLTDCWWGGRYFKCCDELHPIESEYGICYVFNSALLGNSSILTVNRRVGLIDFVFSAVELVGVRIHAPDDIVSIALENILSRSASLPLVTEFEAILKVEQTVNDLSVSSLSETMRGCLFKDDRPPYPDWPFKQYTYSGCLLFCRALAQYSSCNCSHHFLAKIVKIPACNIKGLACLYQSRDEFLKYECNCPMACEDTQYKAVHIFYNRVSGKLSSELMKRGSRARVRFASLPTLRVRRLAIKDTLGLVVDIGGVGGVFFGASLLSVIELIYLFCIRRNRN